MDKIAICIDFGDDLVQFEDFRETIFYLIFELAESDLRVQVRETNRFQTTWSLCTLHNLSTGLKQLHVGNVCHNDLKPANVLLFGSSNQKIADLGRATSPSFPALHDDACCAGDPQYSAPELLYARPATGSPIPSFEERRAADLYQLGSIAFYLFKGTMVTPEVLLSMNAVHRPMIHGPGWSGSFSDVLPFWREAFARVMQNFDDLIGSRYDDAEQRVIRELIPIINALCEPDPRLRGDPAARSGKQDVLGLQRYISKFDLLRYRAMRN